MRTLLLSLKPEVFESILSGKKIYEHRRVFPNESVVAYVYVSRPVQALKGILYLENKVDLMDWRDKYSYDNETVKRIDKYMEHHKVAVEIRKFQNTTEIPLSVVREKFPNFIIPQMYYYLEDLPLLNYLEDNLEPIGTPVTHRFDNITSDMICIY